MAVASIAGLLVLASPAQASCIRSTERDYLKRADAVFVGRVTSVGPSGASARFRVLSVRKGRIDPGSVVKVVAEPYPSSITISWTPKPGQRWRVYVKRSGKRWTTSDCMGTRRAA